MLYSVYRRDKLGFIIKKTLQIEYESGRSKYAVFYIKEPT